MKSIFSFSAISQASPGIKGKYDEKVKEERKILRQDVKRSKRHLQGGEAQGASIFSKRLSDDGALAMNSTTENDGEDVGYTEDNKAGPGNTIYSYLINSLG